MLLAAGLVIFSPTTSAQREAVQDLLQVLPQDLLRLLLQGLLRVLLPAAHFNSKYGAQQNVWIFLVAILATAISCGCGSVMVRRARNGGLTVEAGIYHRPQILPNVSIFVEETPVMAIPSKFGTAMDTSTRNGVTIPRQSLFTSLGKVM